MTLLLACKQTAAKCNVLLPAEVGIGWECKRTVCFSPSLLVASPFSLSLVTGNITLIHGPDPSDGDNNNSSPNHDDHTVQHGE